MKVIPNPAMMPNIASALAAPNPETRPDQRPSANVRRMHNTPIGPTGAAMEKPMIRPRINMFIATKRKTWDPNCLRDQAI